MPKMMEPTDRNMSMRVMPQVMSVFDLPKLSARSLTVSDTVKKSNASHVYFCGSRYGKSICLPNSWMGKGI
jgi:hypothetical protein